MLRFCRTERHFGFHGLSGFGPVGKSEYSLKRAWSGSGKPFKNFTPRIISPQRLQLETSNFVHGSAMRSLSLVMSECSLSARDHGHVSNFYIVD